MGGGLIGVMVASLYEPKCCEIRPIQRLHGGVLRSTLAPVLELDEHLALVLAAAGEINPLTMNVAATALLSSLAGSC